MAETFLEAVKAVIDAVPGVSPVVVDHRPEDLAQIPADLVVHMGQVPTGHSNCSVTPTFCDDRFEVLIFRHTLPEVETLAAAVMDAWNAADLEWTGVEVSVVYRELYRAGLALRPDGSPMRDKAGKQVHCATLQYLAQYAPAR